MKIIAEGTPKEITELLQAIESSKEQYKNDLIDIESDGKKLVKFKFFELLISNLSEILFKIFCKLSRNSINSNV